MPNDNGGPVSNNVPRWKNFVIGAVTLPDLVSSATPVPLLPQPNLTSNDKPSFIQQVAAPERTDLFQLDQSVKDLADYKDIQDEQQRARSLETGYALREPDQVQMRPDTRGER